MIGKVSSRLLGISLLLVAAGCNKTDTGGAIDAGGSAAAPTPAVVQGACPQVFLLDGTAVHTAYAKGAKDDPAQVMYQSTLVNTTRQCVQNESQLVMTVVAQGRVTPGPAGTGGTITLPIRVAATDGQTTLYSELTQYPVTVQPGAGAAQFIFTKANITLPGGAGSFAKVYVGFDEGPQGKKKKK